MTPPLNQKAEVNIWKKTILWIFLFEEQEKTLKPCLLPII